MTDSYYSILLPYIKISEVQRKLILYFALFVRLQTILLFSLKVLDFSFISIIFKAEFLVD